MKLKLDRKNLNMLSQRLRKGLYGFSKFHIYRNDDPKLMATYDTQIRYENIPNKFISNKGTVDIRIGPFEFWEKPIKFQDGFVEIEL